MTYPAPKYLKDDPWFGPAFFSLYQTEYKLEYQQVVEELKDFLSIYMINFQMKEKNYETPANDRVS